jgi:DNA-directed RNA polymerase subunit RPC12/RpoP
MFTVAEARALGFPVYVRCITCGAQPRPLQLDALDSAMDLESAARAGRFKCRSCGGKVSHLAPALYLLIAKRERLRLVCINCGKDQAFSAAQACMLFGLATPLDELRARLKCREGCTMSVGFMTQGEVVSKSGSDVISFAGAGRL